jgi:hypothetical protein
MSALGGGLNGSTQHFILEGKDGVCSEGSAISSRVHSGREGGAVKPLAERGESLKRADGRLVSRHLPFIAKQPGMGGDLTQVLRRPVELAAQSGHLDCAEGCPLLGVKRTLQFDRAMSASDPKRTLGSQSARL